MFKKIRRYLLFLFMFTFATTNIADLGVFVEEETLEAASVQTELQTKIQTETEDLQEDVQKKQYCDFDVSSQEVLKNEEILIENFYDTSLESVSYYIHTHKKLPPMYITKKEAQSLGWLGGSLADIDCGKSIGGDYFGNYQGLLPSKDGRCYWECDIDTLGADTRGRKRLVYSNDGLMFYTEDHYATFQMLAPELYSIKNQIL